jgi:hypothetical protein
MTEASSVRVVCRFRPPPNKKVAVEAPGAGESKQKFSKQAAKVEDNAGFLLKFGSEGQTVDIRAIQASQPKPISFTFDSVFPQSATQEDVFDAIAKATVKDVLRGCESCAVAFCSASQLNVLFSQTTAPSLLSV